MAKTAEAKTDKKEMRKGEFRKFRLKKDVGPHFEPNPDHDPELPDTEENPRDVEYAPGEIVKTNRPLDKLFVNKFETIDSGDRTDKQSAGGDVPDPENDPDLDRPVRDYESARVNAPDRHLEEDELEGKPKLQKLAKGKKPKSAEASDAEDEESPEEDEEATMEEEDEEEEGLGQDVTKSFADAKDAGLKVFKDSEGKYRLTSEDDEQTPLEGAKKGFTKKVNVKAFIKRHAAKAEASEE